MKEIFNKDEVLGFLEEYPSTKIYTSQTIKSGYVSCIRPVPTIFGPELIVNADTFDSLMELRKGYLNG